MPDLFWALIPEMLGVLEYAAVVFVAGSWAWTIVRLWRHHRRYLSETTSELAGEDVLEALPQHLSIAGLVLAALAIGSGFAPVADLLVISLAAFVYAWIIGWVPRSSVAQLGGDALTWNGVTALLAAVFGYAAGVGQLAQASIMVVTLAAARGSVTSQRANVKAAGTRRRVRVPVGTSDPGHR